MLAAILAGVDGLLIGGVIGLAVGLLLTGKSKMAAAEFRDDVIWAYKEILGRSTENESFIDLWAGKGLQIEERAAAFMESAEFKSLSHAHRQRAHVNLRRRLRSRAIASNTMHMSPTPTYPS